jgi:hypothetical protein
MTPEDKALFIKLFGGPRQLGRDRFGGRLMDLVRLPDGTVGFVPNESQAKWERIFDETLDEIFGPEPEQE